MNMSPFASLRSGYKIPMIGLGTWKSGADEVVRAVEFALECGYRHIDCAPIYGNEAAIGEVFAKRFAAGLQRQEVFVTSKLWNSSHHPDDVPLALEQTLSDLQLDYLDLYLIHWPIVFRRGVSSPKNHDDLLPLSEIAIADTWGAMEKLVKAGKVKSIGVSNFSVQKLQDLVKHAATPPLVNQVEIHPYLQQRELRQYCQDRGIHQIAYSPLGSPDRMANLRAEDEPVLLADPVVKEIAAKHRISIGQTLIAWALHQGNSVIPKSVNPQRIRENLLAAEVRLDDEDMKSLSLLERGYRFVNPSSWFAEGSPYKMNSFW